MKKQDLNQQPQQLTDDMFSFPDPEVVDSVEETPEQLDVTLTENVESEEDVPLVGEETSEEKPVETKVTKAEKPAEPKVDFLKAMRDNDLEVFTKESVTDDVTDEEFANQLIIDKHFGESSYPKAIDFDTYEYFPEHISKQVKTLEEDIGRAVANLTPEEKKILATEKGGNERVFNKHTTIANENIGKIALASAAIGGAAVAIPAIPVATTVGAFVATSAVAFGLIYDGFSIVNAVDRAERTSPEELKGLNETKDDKSLVETYGPEKVSNFLKELFERDEDDSKVEAYAKELGRVATDPAAFYGLFKTASAMYKVGANTTDVLRSTSKPNIDASTADKLADLIQVKQTIKEKNKVLAKAKESMDEIITRYESGVPPIPDEVAKKSIDYNAMAGEAYDKFAKSGYKDNEAYESFLYNSAKGSDHTRNTKRTVELSKDASEADLAKLPSSEKFGKGSEGTGTTIMDYANKLDDLGRQRKFAVDSGNFEMDAQLDTLQSHLMDRINIDLTKAGGNLQEINRSMPLRKSMNKLYRSRTQNALELNRKNITKKHRARLEKEQAKIDRQLNILTTNMEGATETELAMMGVANTIYSNMLSGAAISKAGIGGLVSTTSNNVNLLARGITPDQIFKMQVNSLKRLAGDVRKVDLSQLKSDIVSGSINSRFKTKNVANLKANVTDSTTKASLKTMNKGVNIAAAPIQGGLGLVDHMMDTFNAQQRAVEAWLDYSRRQKALGRTSEELVEELNKFVDKPELMSETFNREVLKAAEEGLATDKMMLTKGHSNDYAISKVGWGIDQAFNTVSNNIVLDTAIKFVNPFTRTGASMLDSIAENTVIGMFRGSPVNPKFAALTSRQLIGTAAAYGLFYGLKSDIESVPQSAEKTAGAFGLRSGLQIGGHQFPMSILGVYGEAIEKFMVMQHAMEATAIDTVDASNIGPIMGGLLEVSTAYGMGENLRQLAQTLMNIPEGKSKLDVTKIIENYLPAGYVAKAGADLTEGSLAVNPFLAQVFGRYSAEFGNAKRRDAFGTPLTEGETLEMDRNYTWLLDRKGEDEAGLKLKKSLLNAGLFSSSQFAAFKTEDGLVPYSSIMIDGNYTPFSATMTPLTHAVTVGKGRQVRVSSATRNKALGVMSLEKNTMANIIDEELTNLNYLDVNTPEAKALRQQAMLNMRLLRKKTQQMLNSLSKYGMNKTLPKAMNMLLEKNAPNISATFDQKRYEITNLMKYNRHMFGGNRQKQKEFFTRVNRVKDTVLFYNSVKDIGSKFMMNSAEAISAEIKRIEQMKAKRRN